METSQEQPLSQPNEFSLQMLQYFNEGIVPYEHAIEGSVLRIGMESLFSGRVNMPSQQELEKMLKIDSIAAVVKAGTHMKVQKENYIRELVASEDSVKLHLEFIDGYRKGKVTEIEWSNPFITERGKKFSRFESMTKVPADESIKGGSIGLFYDVPQGGTKRFQYLLSLNGFLRPKQKNSFQNEILGGTFSPDGKILQPGSYYLTDEERHR